MEASVKPIGSSSPVKLALEDSSDYHLTVSMPDTSSILPEVKKTSAVNGQRSSLKNDRIDILEIILGFTPLGLMSCSKPKSSRSEVISHGAKETKSELGAMDWDVNPGRIQSGQISSSGNSVTVKDATTSDATGFKFNTTSAQGFQYLVISIKEKATGSFNWSGRVFKIEFDERPVNPENVSADEYYLWTNAEGKIYYKIPAGLRDIQIVLGRMTNGNVVLEFYLANGMEK